jgi:tetratricopeptide (TPR) repeat protein
MKIQSVVIASVSAVFLATGVAVTAVSAAETKSPAVLMQQAYTNLVSGKAEQAVAGYTDVIDNASTPVQDRARALLNRALAYQKLSRQDKALEDYTSAIKLDALNAKTRAAALYNRGLAHARLKQNFEAVEDFTNALYLDPHLSEAFYSRANVLRDSGQFEYALMDYSRAEQAGYRHPHLTWYGKAVTYMDLGHRDEATAAFLKVYGLKPDFKEARERLADLGVDVPANPSENQIKLAVIPAQNLMADDLVTGSTSAATLRVAKSGQKEPVAPPPALLSGLKPVAMPMFDVASNMTAPVKPLPARPEAISVEDVGPVPMAQQTAEPQAVQIEPVSAPAPTQVNLAAVPDSEPVSQKLEGWTVQLVSQRDAESAWSNWTRIQDKHERILKGLEAAVIKADLGQEGIYYRLRVHKLDSKKDASDLCRRLKRAGTNCFVARAS